MTARDPVSLWQTTALEPCHDAPLGHADVVDVAIVGGGYTGLSTALHSAQAGLSCHVLEARHIGFGGSGRNVGLVNAAAWLPPQKVRQTLGEPYGSRFLSFFGGGPAAVFDLIETHQIQCEATRTGTIHAAHGPKGYVELKHRHAEWQRLGEPVELLTRQEVRERVGTKAYFGGLLDHRAGTINPMGYCRGLARAALGAGAKISTETKVTKLVRDGALWRVETEQGDLRARSVVLGTNAYTDGLWPGLKDIFTVIHYFQFATTPLGPDADPILPGRQGLWDTGPIMFNIRRDAEGRLLVGSMGRVLGTKDRGLTQRFVRKELSRLFPALGPVAFEQAWHGQIALTPDHLPKILELAEGLYTPIGYNGRGITTGTLFGQIMVQILTGADRSSLPLPLQSKMTPAPRAGLKGRLYQAAFTANQLRKAV